MIRPLVLILLATPAAALTPDDIRGASYDGGALPDGQSGLAFRLQVLLDRAAISPGVVDGYAGGMTESALRAFETREGMEADGVMDQEVWAALGGADAAPILIEHVIVEDDLTGIVDAIPDDFAKMAEMELLGFTRPTEALAERFHMDEDTLVALNDGTAFEVGQTILVAAPRARAQGEVARIEVRKGVQRLTAFDADGNVLANYPVTVGSGQTPSPKGTHKVAAVAVDPTYSYRPDANFQQGENDEPLTLPPGPNGPVGSTWIDLSEPTFGIHGTPDPARLFEEQSHGCVRMTNWDVRELAQMVGQGVPVEFIE